MTVFYTTLALTYLLGLIITLGSERYKKLKIIILLAVVSIFVIVSGTRTGIGDTYFYKHSYELLAQNPVMDWSGKDFGFTFLSLFLLTISTNPQILVFVTSLFTQTFNLLVLYQYRNLFELQVYMYVTSGYWLTSMNGIRQALAASILFLGTSFLVKGKFIYYLIVVLIASTFHTSALIMIPVYFVVRERPWSKRIWQLIGLLVVCFVLYDIFEPIFYKLIADTSYSEYSVIDEGGSSFMRAFIGLIPIFLSYIFKDKLLSKWPKSSIFVNMSLINGIILCFSMYNWIFARLTYYFQLYNFILLPFLISLWPHKKQKRLIYFGFLVCYFIFMYYEQVMGGLGLGYKSIISWF
ncbi:EpsG family protein [Turicibacter sanguinis]|uniref:EpsG family protein n=1 Tax=Turicibacter sanguinis TaxID=154288 RepID=UPI0018AA6A60|nr:EpsG family protein [Turicibacter sanguinis]MDB8558400.1 EpsG family protein [Turicibacter sanguinis]MDB8561196.1 EpsG family protein [Turicibacter sanguinis]